MRFAPAYPGPCLPACLHDGGICAGVGLGAGPVVGRLPATLMTKMNTNEHLQQARQLHDQWQFEQARQAYEKVLEQEPAHAEALHGMAQLLGLHQLRSAEALPYLEAAIGVRPADFGYWRLYIHMLIREGLLDMAISLIDVARANGMQEIALEQLEKDVALVQGAQAAAFWRSRPRVGRWDRPSPRWHLLPAMAEVGCPRRSCAAGAAVCPARACRGQPAGGFAGAPVSQERLGLEAQGGSRSCERPHRGRPAGR